MSRKRLPPWAGVALVLYAVLTLWLTLHHEAWCDEADTWLLMRDGGVGVMLSRTSYAGTPALWYLLLAPFASAGLPYLAQQLLTLVLAWCAMTLFVIDAPFRPALKILFLFSYYAAYEYAVEARPYALLIALLFAIVATWRQRAEKPLRVAILTALLANTTVHGLLIAAILGAIYSAGFFRGPKTENPGLKRHRSLVAMAIMLIGGILSVIQLFPPELPAHHRYIDPGTVPWAIGNAFLPGVDARISFAAGLVVLLLAVLAIGDRTGPLLFVTLSIAALLLLFVFVWVAGFRHTGLILIVLLAGLWMAGTDGTRPWRDRTRRYLEVALALCFAWGIYVAAEEAIAETKWASSGSREMAEYIAANVPDSTVIVAEPPVLCEPVLVYLPGRRFWYPEREQFGSYMMWSGLSGRSNGVRRETTVEVARRRFAGRKWLLLVNTQLAAAEGRGLRLLATNRRKVYAHMMERYWLYSPD